MDMKLYMINNYVIFVKRLVKGLVMLYLSKEFTSLLSRISYNKISSILLNINNYKIRSDYNYINIGSSNNLVSFVPSSKVSSSIVESIPKIYGVREIRNLTHSKSNNKIFDLLGYDTSNAYWYPVPSCSCSDDGYNDCGCSPGTRGIILNEVVSNISNKTYVLYKCIDTNRLSVVNKVALVGLEDIKSKLFNYNRNSIRIGRLVNYIMSKCGVEFSKSEVEEFVNLYKSSYDFINDGDIQFNIVSGRDIAYWYNKGRYVVGGGVLNNSCMCSKDDEYFDLYVRNSQCSMLILYDDSDGLLKGGRYVSSKIRGRALLWDIGDGVKFMDRIYTVRDSDIELFKAYAGVNNWWYKDQQCSGDGGRIINGRGDVLEGGIKIVLDNPDHKYYPYLDTMCYYTNDGVLVSNWSDIECVGGREYKATDGRYYNINARVRGGEENVEEVEEELLMPGGRVFGRNVMVGWDLGEV